MIQTHNTSSLRQLLPVSLLGGARAHKVYEPSSAYADMFRASLINTAAVNVVGEPNPMSPKGDKAVKTLLPVSTLPKMNPFVKRKMKSNGPSFLWFQANKIRSELKLQGCQALFMNLGLAYAAAASDKTLVYRKVDNALMREKRRDPAFRKAYKTITGVCMNPTLLMYGLTVKPDKANARYLVDMPICSLASNEIVDSLLRVFTTKRDDPNQVGDSTEEATFIPMPSHVATVDVTMGTLETAAELDGDDDEAVVPEEPAGTTKISTPEGKIDLPDSVMRNLKVDPNATPDPEGQSEAFMGITLKELPFKKFCAENPSVNIPSRQLHNLLGFTTHIVAKKIALGYVVCLRMIVTSEEAELLTSTDFNDIRGMDIFGAMETLVRTGYGVVSRKAPRYIVPISKIARETPKTIEDYRGNADLIGCEDSGRLIYLPRDINNIPAFEGVLASTLAKPDGSFSIPITNAVPFPLGQDIILTDYVNMVISYVNTEQRFSTLALDKIVPANETHYTRFLSKPFANDMVANLHSYLIKMATSSGITNEDFTAQTLFNEGNVADSGALDVEKFNYVQLFELRNLYPKASLFIEVCKKLAKRIEVDLSASFSTYSVTTVLHVLALVKIIAKHGEDVMALKARDLELRKVYLDTKQLDPKFKPEPVPFLRSEGLSFMPHQGKMANQMRGNPKLTVIAAQAGAGKTMATVYHILKRMKDGVHPWAIFCPSHLVAQYFEEFVYATDGRINTICITTSTVRKYGFVKLREMILDAPRNTVIISDYNIIKQSVPVGYGPNKTDSYPVASFIKQFNPEGCVLDESHYLKADNSKRQGAMLRVISNVVEKVIMSGTLAANRVTDLVKQVALLDPTIFGSVSDFIGEWALETKGTKVTKWKPGYELEVMRRLSEGACFVKVMRKEWAAILPKRIDAFYPVEMSKNQKHVYNMIITSAVEEFMQAAQTDKRLAKLLKKLSSNTAIEEEDKNTVPTFDPDGNIMEDEEDEDDIDDMTIESLLRPYLQRLEMFTVSPGKDALGAEMLKGPDLVSPKVVQCAEICLKHIESGNKGKIIIFVNFKDSADAAYEYLETIPALSGKIIYYKASIKDAAIAAFNKDDTKQIMLGISQSMDTGLNLQTGSRLIRLQSVWTPGVLEQGNSRIERPSIKNGKELRPYIWMDTILCEDTIDITKAAFLMTKVIESEKFYNAGDPRYDNIETPELFKMTIENIFNMNNTATLIDYTSAYGKLRQAIVEDYEEYRAKNQGKLDFIPLERSENLPDSKHMLRVPYVAGLTVYGTSKLGLVRYDEYMNLNKEDIGEEDDTPDDENSTQRELSAIETAKVAGLPVHTEYGDGSIVKATKRRLTVELSSGEKVTVHKLTAFVITRAETNNSDVRLAQTKMAGNMPLDVEPNVPASPTPKAKKQKPEAEVVVPKARPASFKLSIAVYNDFLCLQLDNSDDERAVAKASDFAFRPMNSFFYTKIWNPKQFYDLIMLWKAAGMKMDTESSAHLKSAFEFFKKFGAKNATFFGTAAKNNWRNFLLKDFKPNSDKFYFEPFPLIMDDTLYIGMPASKQVGTKYAMQQAMKTVKGEDGTRWSVSRIQWRLRKGEDTYVRFLPNRQEGVAVLKQILNSGIRISNLEDVKAELKELKVYRRNTD